jgi:hypothetical protein
MLRWILVVLLAANALMWAWGRGWLGGSPGSTQREPERLAQQQSPERLKWLSAEEAQKALRHVPVCREVGPWPDLAAVPAARAALGALGVQDLQAWVHTQPGEWAVATRPADDADELARKKQVLARVGVEAKAERLGTEAQRSWVVSRHSSRNEAQAELNRLRDKGLRALRLVTTQEPSRNFYLRSADWPAAQAQATGADWPGAPRACAAGLSAVPEAAPAAASSPASAGR